MPSRIFSLTLEKATVKKLTITCGESIMNNLALKLANKPGK